MKRFAALLCIVLFVFCQTACKKEETSEIPDHSVFLENAERLFLEGQYEEAILQYEAAIKIEPRNAEVYAKAAEVHLAAGNIEEAIRLLKTATELMPEQKYALKLEEIQTEYTVKQALAAYEQYYNQILIPKYGLSDCAIVKAIDEELLEDPSDESKKYGIISAATETLDDDKIPELVVLTYEQATAVSWFGEEYEVSPLVLHAYCFKDGDVKEIEVEQSKIVYDLGTSEPWGDNAVYIVTGRSGSFIVVESVNVDADETWSVKAWQYKNGIIKPALDLFYYDGFGNGYSRHISSALLPDEMMEYDFPRQESSNDMILYYEECTDETHPEPSYVDDTFFSSIENTIVSVMQCLFDGVQYVEEYYSYDDESEDFEVRLQYDHNTLKVTQLLEDQWLDHGNVIGN